MDQSGTAQRLRARLDAVCGRLENPGAFASHLHDLHQSAAADYEHSHASVAQRAQPPPQRTVNTSNTQNSSGWFTDATNTTRPLSFDGHSTNARMSNVNIDAGEIESRMWGSSIRALESAVQSLTADVQTLRHDLEKEKGRRVRAERQLQAHLDSVARSNDEIAEDCRNMGTELGKGLSNVSGSVSMLPTAQDILFWTNKMGDIGEIVQQLVAANSKSRVDDEKEKHGNSDENIAQLRQILSSEIRNHVAEETKLMRRTMNQDFRIMRYDVEKSMKNDLAKDTGIMMSDLRAQLAVSVAEGIEEMRKIRLERDAQLSEEPVIDVVEGEGAVEREGVPEREPVPEAEPEAEEPEVEPEVEVEIEPQSQLAVTVEEGAESEGEGEGGGEDDEKEEEEVAKTPVKPTVTNTSTSTARVRNQHQRRSTRPEEIILTEVQKAFAKTISPQSVERVRRSVSYKQVFVMEGDGEGVASPLGIATAAAAVDAVTAGIGTGVIDTASNTTTTVDNNDKEGEGEGGDGGQRRCSLNCPAPKQDEILDWENQADLLSETLRDGIAIFNRKARKGVEFLVSHNLLHPAPLEVARFLRYCNELDVTQVGEYIGGRDPYQIKVLEHYVCTFDFAGLSIVMAMRSFLNIFKLPGESQMIDRIVQKFALHYHDTNPNGPFVDSDAVYVLSFSIILLNTDAHNPRIRKKDKMTRSQFIKNNRGINGGGDIASSVLSAIYKDIVKNEIVMNV